MKKAIVGFLLIGVRLWACTCEVANDSETLLESTSAKGAEVIVRIPQRPVTESSTKAFVCSDPLSKMDLWMPEHGHGSGPTKITESTEGCSTVERIKFLMKGKWELRLQFQNKDTATVLVDVK